MPKRIEEFAPICKTALVVWRQCGAGLLPHTAPHGLVVLLRQFPSFTVLIDRRPALLVARGKVLKDERHCCGLTRSDLYGALRRQGVEDPDEARHVVLEPRRQISVVCRNIDADLVRDIVEQTRGGRLGG